MDSILKIQDMPRPGTTQFHAQQSVFLFYADFNQIARNTKKRILQTQTNLALRLEKEYAQAEEALRTRDKIIEMKRRAKLNGDETVTEDLELKPKEVEKIQIYERAQKRLLQCLRALGMELDITELFLHYSRDELIENYKLSQRK